MSEELNDDRDLERDELDPEDDFQDEEIFEREEIDPADDEDGQFEVITSDEVDRILAELERLIDSTDSENIQVFLEDAHQNIYSLIYDEDGNALEDDDSVSDAA